MNITYLQRKELNALSKDIFGVESKWRNLTARIAFPQKDNNGVVTHNLYLRDYESIKDHLVALREVQLKRSKKPEKAKSAENKPGILSKLKSILPWMKRNDGTRGSKGSTQNRE